MLIGVHLRESLSLIKTLQVLSNLEAKFSLLMVESHPLSRKYKKESSLCKS